MLAKAHWGVPLHRNTYLLSANLLVTLVTGMGFWILASRLFSPSQIGVATAFIAPTTFLSMAFLLGANHGILRFASEFEQDKRLLFSAISISALVSLAGSAIGAILLMNMGLVHAVAGSSILSILIYALLVSTTTVWSVCEAAFVGLRAPRQILVRNVALGFIRLLILLAFAGLGDFGLVAALTLGTGMAALVSLALLRRHLHATWAEFFTVWHPGLRRIISFALPNHFANLIASVPIMLMPLMALHLLGAEISGYYYVAWTIAAVLKSLLTASSATLLAEGSRDHSIVGSGLARSLAFLFCLVGAAALPVLLFPGIILAPFGAQYVDANSIALPLLTLSMLPSVLTTVFSARERVKKRVRGIALLAIASCVLGTVLPYVGAQTGGYTGFATWYLLSQCLLGLAVLPALAGSILNNKAKHVLIQEGVSNA